MSAQDERSRDVVAAEMCEVGRRAWQRGYCAGNDGNYSVRLGPDRVLCTPTGVSKGFMSPDMLCEVGFDGRQRDGSGHRITSEIRVHLAIYAARPDVTAVVHAHPPHAVAFCLTHVSLPVTACPEAYCLLGDVPLAAYAAPGTDAVADAAVRVITPRTRAVLLANHGAVTFSDTLLDAYHRMEILDNFCRTLIAARSLGELRLLTPSQLDQLAVS
jgi:L-fuculose-phosphate aldolase